MQKSKLNAKQSQRLYNIIEEYKHSHDLSLRDLVKETGVSLGRLCMLNPNISGYKPCTRGIAL